MGDLEMELEGDLQVGGSTLLISALPIEKE